MQSQTKTLLKETLKQAIKRNELAGANLLVLKHGKELYYHQDGVMNIETKKPIERDTLFRWFSMTKPITATAIMMLMENGHIDLFDPVSTYLHGFINQKVYHADSLQPVAREMTIRDLLNMTSGLLYPNPSEPGKAIGSLIEAIDKGYSNKQPITTVEAMNQLGQIPLAFNPGSHWAYGTSADVLGAIVEVVSGKPFGLFLKEHLFEPLDMKDTGFFVPKAQQHRLASVYGTTKNNTLEPFLEHHLAIINKMDIAPSFESGGAGLVGTIDDYAKFATMLMNNGTAKNKQILKPETIAFLTSSTLDGWQQSDFDGWHTLSGHSYGNLLRVVTDTSNVGFFSRVGEYGWDGWLGCYFANIPSEALTILVMMQKKDAGTTSLTRKLRNIIMSDC